MRETAAGTKPLIAMREWHAPFGSDTVSLLPRSIASPRQWIDLELDACISLLWGHCRARDKRDVRRILSTAVPLCAWDGRNCRRYIAGQMDLSRQVHISGYLTYICHSKTTSH